MNAPPSDFTIAKKVNALRESTIAIMSNILIPRTSMINWYFDTTVKLEIFSNFIILLNISPLLLGLKEMKTEYTSPVRAMRSNPPQYFVISVNGYEVLEAGENWLWQRRGPPLRNISPSSVEEPAPYNSLSSPCIADIVELVDATGSWGMGSKRCGILSLDDKLDLKSKLAFRIPHNTQSNHNSISKLGLNYNFLGELLARKGKGGAI
jgi:hypothetical protein